MHVHGVCHSLMHIRVRMQGCKAPFCTMCFTAVFLDSDSVQEMKQGNTSFHAQKCDTLCVHGCADMVESLKSSDYLLSSHFMICYLWWQAGHWCEQYMITELECIVCSVYRS